MDGETRYHAEVKVNVEGHDARINCFADTLDAIFEDIGVITAQFSATQGVKPTKAGKPAEAPVCANCETNEFMELIKWTGDDGKRRQAWKCQQCQKWHWDKKNSKGK